MCGFVLGREISAGWQQAPLRAVYLAGRSQLHRFVCHNRENRPPFSLVTSTVLAGSELAAERPEPDDLNIAYLEVKAGGAMIYGGRLLRAALASCAPAITIWPTLSRQIPHQARPPSFLRLSHLVFEA